MTGTPLIGSYSPDTRWGEQHVEVTLMQWDYAAAHVVKVGGNCRGMEVLDSAIGLLFDALCDDVADDAPAGITLTRPNGETLRCDDDEDREEDWLKDMVVGIRIIDYTPPSLNEVRELNGAPPVPEGDRPYPPR